MHARGARPFSLDRLTEAALRALVDAPEPLVILLPVGSVEPHGPHLALATDTVISEGAAERAAALLEADGCRALIAPSIPFGVTECARQFCGAVSVPPKVLTAYVEAVVGGLVAAGARHVCVINNHLEPAHDEAIRASVESFGDRASVATPLTRRWARTLSDEFKSGACHAGRYETSIVLAEDPSLVDEGARAKLPAVPISLSEKLKAGISDFVEMGLDRAYAGDPAAASAEEGSELLDRLATMIATEVREALARGA